MKKRDGAKPRGKSRRFSMAFALDEAGVAARALPSVPAAENWLDKHFPGLSPEEKRKRVWRLTSRKGASKFFEDQIRRGCKDPEVLSFVELVEGVATPWRLDLRRGRISPLGEKPGKRPV